ncbi:MAG: hypothetical protein K9J28_07080 [Sulfuritalea sp.]|nr:hypothetical protein [Sulfuritalea sp.]
MTSDDYFKATMIYGHVAEMGLELNWSYANFHYPQQVDCRTAESYCRDLENTLEMEREVYFYLSID